MFLVGGSGHGRRRAECSAAAAAAAAAMGPLAADRAAWRRRRACIERAAVGASVGARRPSSGPQLDVRRPELLQRGPAQVQRARARAFLLMYYRRAQVAGVVCACMRYVNVVSCEVACVCRHAHAAGSRQTGAGVASCRLQPGGI